MKPRTPGRSAALRDNLDSPTHRVDVAILGGGTAGQAARAEAAALGASVAVLEEADLRTTCASVGCVPSKLLVAAAAKAHEVRTAAKFGVGPTVEGKVDGAAALRRIRELRDEFVHEALASTEAWADQLIRGRGRFIDATTLEVDEGRLRIEANAVVVATGAMARIPAEAAHLGDLALTSDDVFELESLPASLAVVGGGCVGLELGQALARLGVEVTLFEKERHLALLQDEALIREAMAAFSADARIDFVRGVEPRLHSHEGRVRVAWEENGRPREIDVDRVLLATGRPASDWGLNLRSAGLPVEGAAEASLYSPTTRQCGDLPVFFAGDVSGRESSRHMAAHDGAIAGRNAATFPHVSATPRPVPLSIVFTEPQIAAVGAPPEELAAFDDLVVGEARVCDQTRARISGELAGRIRIFARRERGALVGGLFLAPHAEHLAHLLAWAIGAGRTVFDLLRTPYYHPTFEEGLQSALQAAARQLGQLPRNGQARVALKPPG